MAKKPKPIAEQLRQAIADADKAGVSGYRIAQLTGMSRSQIHSIANGKTVPKLDTAERIAAAIGHTFLLQRD